MNDKTDYKGWALAIAFGALLCWMFYRPTQSFQLVVTDRQGIVRMDTRSGETWISAGTGSAWERIPENASPPQQPKAQKQTAPTGGVDAADVDNDDSTPVNSGWPAAE